MPTIKIADPPPPPCRHPDHNPPSHRVFDPGTYQHTCPKCGASSTFVVEKPRLIGRTVLKRRNQLWPAPPHNYRGWDPRSCNSARIYGRYPT